MYSLLGQLSPGLLLSKYIIMLILSNIHLVSILTGDKLPTNYM